jgi:hypothetical protein
MGERIWVAEKAIKIIMDKFEDDLPYDCNPFALKKTFRLVKEHKDGRFLGSGYYSEEGNTKRVREDRC